MIAKRLIILSILFVVASADNYELEELIKMIFKTQGPNNLNSQIIDEMATKNSVTPPDNQQKTPKSCGIDKKCVREYLCSNGHTNTDGATLINVRIDFDIPNECGFLETCCSISKIVDVPIVRTSDTPDGCGYRNVDGVGFKIEGATTEAEFGEFPWMVAILRGMTEYDEKRDIYQCGGSLIHPKVVLTGAHCVYDKSPKWFKVRAGEWETNSKTELYPDQNRLVVDMAIHADYNKANLHNDVALLFLESPFELAPNVNPVCLPPAEHIFDFDRCYATGWGKDQFQKGQYQNILKKIDLPVVPNYVCQDNLRKTRLGTYFELDKSFMCAGGEAGKDTCEGDGGSPLVCPIENSVNRFYQAGIVAWGIGCGEKDVPGVYANVALFRRWIDEKLAARAIVLPRLEL